MDTATTKLMTLTELASNASGVLDMIDEATALNPSDCHRMPIVDPDDEVLDGFNRTAGMLLWARENDIDPDTYQIRSVVLLDDTLIEEICEHGMEDQGILDRIYDAVASW